MAPRHHGRFRPRNFSVAQLANALEISPGVIRRHFIDLEGLLVEILERHLRALSDAIGRVPDDAPDPPAARRAAYLAFTRTPKGGPTEAHLLLTRDRFTLPPEDQEKLDVMRLGLGAELGGVTAESVLSLLDSPTLGSDEIEALIARRAAQFAAQLAALAVPPVPPEARPKPHRTPCRSVPNPTSRNHHLGPPVRTTNPGRNRCSTVTCVRSGARAGP